MMSTPPRGSEDSSQGDDRLERGACDGRGENNMDTSTLLIIIVVVLLLGGGGWYGRGRWF
jgi:hypothetical protein